MLSRGRLRRSQREDGDDVNLSPLIDMTFLLLIFFAVSSTFIKDLEVSIERPSAASAEIVERPPLRVQLDRDGHVYVDAEPVRVWMLERHVRDRLRRSRIDDVLVVVDRETDAGQLLSVVDQCRLAGASHVGVAVREAE